MLRTAALPFVVRRSHDIVSLEGISSTQEALYGLLRLDGDHLHIQWRTSREISLVGREIRVDRELAPIQEVTLPLTGVAGARLRRDWRRFFRGESLVLDAADLRSFDALAGVEGLLLEHPAELTLQLRRRDRQLARNFVSELRLALSELQLRESEAELEAMRDPVLDQTDELSEAPSATRVRSR